MVSNVDKTQKRVARAAKLMRHLIECAKEFNDVVRPTQTEIEDMEWAVESLEELSRYGNPSEAFGVKAPGKNKAGIKSAANKNAEGRQERDTAMRDLWCFLRMREAVKQAKLNASHAAAKGEKIKVVITEIIKGVASDIARDEEFKLKAGIGEPPSVSLLMKIWEAGGGLKTILAAMRDGPKPQAASKKRMADISTTVTMIYCGQVNYEPSYTIDMAFEFTASMFGITESEARLAWIEFNKLEPSEKALLAL